MQVSPVNFKGNSENTENAKLKKAVKIGAGVAVGAAIALGGAYALGRTSPKFWVAIGGITPEGALWDGYKAGNPNLIAGVKEGFKRLPKLAKSIKKVIVNKSVVLDEPSKISQIKNILKGAFTNGIF